MAIFSLAQRTTATGSGAANQEIIPSASTAYRLLEYGFTQVTAVAGGYGLGKPAAIGGAPTTPVTALAEDAGNTTAAQTTAAVAWGTGPTVPANFYRRLACPATIGAGSIWTFPRGITVLKAGSTAPNNMVFWNTLAVPVLDTWFVIDE